MVCKKCGYDELVPNGDWLKCPHCGAEYFNTKIDFGSITAPSDDEYRKSRTNDDFSFNIAEKTSHLSDVNDKNLASDSTAQQINDDASAENELNFDNASAEKDKTKKAGKKVKSKKGKEKAPHSKLRETIEFLTPIVIAVILALVLKTFVFANAIVPTGSMINTIQEGDRIIASRLSYIKEDPQRYDIIMFYFPDDEEKVYVKRIIGLPGETVTIVDGVAYVSNENGEISKTADDFITNCIPYGNDGPFYIPRKGETIIFNGEFCFTANGKKVGGEEFIEKYCVKDKSGNYVVAENCYFCMGDNRNSSVDSRMWDNKYVAKNKILGKVKFRYYPSYEQLK